LAAESASVPPASAVTAGWRLLAALPLEARCLALGRCQPHRIVDSGWSRAAAFTGSIRTELRTLGCLLAELGPLGGLLPEFGAELRAVWCVRTPEASIALRTAGA
jgi:hypothetical protein